MSTVVYSDEKSQNTEFGSNIFNTFGVIPINVFQNQNRWHSKRVLYETEVRDYADTDFVR